MSGSSAGLLPRNLHLRSSHWQTVWGGGGGVAVGLEIRLRATS